MLSNPEIVLIAGYFSTYTKFR